MATKKTVISKKRPSGPTKNIHASQPIAKAEKPKSLDDQFEEIATDAITKAEKIDCGFDAFVSGLQSIAGIVSERLQMAREELQRMQEVATTALEGVKQS